MIQRVPENGVIYWIFPVNVDFSQNTYLVTVSISDGFSFFCGIQAPMICEEESPTISLLMWSTISSLWIMEMTTPRRKLRQSDQNDKTSVTLACRASNLMILYMPRTNGYKRRLAENPMIRSIRSLKSTIGLYIEKIPWAHQRRSERQLQGHVSHWWNRQATLFEDFQGRTHW